VRLRQIKLAGFKSFIDPTQIDVPGSLVGVVGPNGCGKSNVIDAVRWVLGESKAAELRGESMQDVIFNGSVNRKPAGRASVELVFDNSDGPHKRSLGGAWGQYNEISVKRVLTRDGTSSYYINNQTVPGAMCTTCSSAWHLRACTAIIARISSPAEFSMRCARPRSAAPQERRRDRELVGDARQPDAGRGHSARAREPDREDRAAGPGRAAVSLAAIVTRRTAAAALAGPPARGGVRA
jgi:energy-coupling factor transporter ATP-binding protein EcfA2